MQTSPRRDPARNRLAVKFWRQMRECDRKGDRAGYMEARTRLFELFERLSFSVVSRLFREEWLSPDDLRQECRVAVIQAIDQWNPERGEFPVLLSYITRNRVRDYLRNSEMIPRSQSVFDQHGQERCHYQEQTTAARLPVLSLDTEGHEDWRAADPEDTYGRIQARIAVAQALDYLDDRTRRIVALHYGLDGCERHTYREMAPLVGHSAQNSHQCVQKALPILAAALAGSF